MVIRVAVSPAYCSVTRGIRARAAVESLLGLPWNRRSLCCGIRARFAVESAFGLAWNTHGKGNKVRVCPIWPRTAQLLRELIRTRPLDTQGSAELPVFVNCRGTQMSRFGVRYLLRKYMLIASTRNPTLAHKEIHPHSLRHTTAIQLLKAGVDFATISQWLGHASLNTTMRYARADIDLKRQALAQVFPEILAPPRGGAFILNGADLVGWLRRL